MTRQLSIGQQLAAIKELRLAEVGRENYVDIHTWYHSANVIGEHCDTSQFSDKVIERISAIYHEHY